MLLNVVLTCVMVKNRSVTKLIVVGGNAKNGGRKNQWRLSLITMKLMHSFFPIFAATDVALVFRDDERNAVYQEHSVLAALLHSLDAILVRGSEVVKVLASGIEF